MNESILVSVREAFLRNVCLEVLINGQVVNLIPNWLASENGKNVLYAQTGVDSTIEPYDIATFSGVNLDLTTNVPVSLLWDRNYVNSRSFPIASEAPNARYELYSHEEEENKRVALENQPSYGNQPQNVQPSYQNNPPVTPKRKFKGMLWIAVPVVAIASIVGTIAVVNNQSGNPIVSEANKDSDKEYEAWYEETKDIDFALDIDQNLDLDGNQKGVYTDYDSFSWRAPLDDDLPTEWVSLYELPYEPESETQIADSIVNLHSDIEVYDWKDGLYNSEKNCMVAFSNRGLTRSKTFIQENNLTDDRAYSELLLNELITELNLKGDVTTTDTYVYKYSSRFGIQMLEANVDGTVILIRGFADTGRFMYSYNNCGLTYDQLLNEQNLPIEMFAYPQDFDEEKEYPSHLPQPE